MGTIAARDALRVLTLTEQVASASLLAAVQGVELRLARQGKDLTTLSPALVATVEAVRRDHPFLCEDRPLETELRAMMVRLQARHYPIYDEVPHV